MEEPLILRDLQITVATPTEDNGSKWNQEDRKLWTVLLFTSTALVWSGRTILPLVASQVAQEFDWNKEQSGIVLGAFLWGYPIFQIFGGILSDRIGGDYVLMRSMLLWSAIAIVTPFVPYYFHTKRGTISSMAFLRFLMGLAQGVQYPSLSSIISRKVPITHKGTVLGIVFSASSCGTLLTGTIGTLLLKKVSWHAVFYAIGGLGIAFSFVLKHYSKKQRMRLNIRDLASNRGKENTVPTRRALFQIVRHRAFWALVFSHSSMVFAMFTIINWFPTFFTESFPEANAWLFNVIPWVVALPASISSGWLADTLIGRKHSISFSRKFIHSMSCLGMAISLFLIGILDSFRLVLGLAAMSLFSQAFSNGGIPLNPNDITPSHAGMVFGIINMCAATQGFLGTYVAGYILHSTQSWTKVFNMTATMSLLSWLVFLAFGQGTSIVD